MTLTIDRLTGLTAHGDHSFSGDTLSIGGPIFGSSMTDAANKRQALSTLSDRGGPLVLASTEDTTIDGYYTLKSLSLDSDVSMYRTGIYGFRHKLTAERLPHWQAAIHTARLTSRERSGAGGVSEDPWWACPSTVKWADINGNTDVYYTRTGPGGSARFYVSAPSLASAIVTYQIDPADYWTMGPYVQVDSAYCLGPSALSIGNADDWELGNGLLKIRGASSSSHTFRLQGPQSGSLSSWGTVTYSIALGARLSGTRRTFNPSHVQVVELTPEVASIRLIGAVSTSGTNDQYRMSVLLRLRRGSTFVEIGFSSVAALAHDIFDVAATSLTVVTAAKTLRSTANDADTNRLWIASGATGGIHTASAGVGEVYLSTAATESGWGMGIEIGGSGSVAPNTVAEQYDHYWADQTVTHEVGG